MCCGRDNLKKKECIYIKRKTDTFPTTEQAPLSHHILNLPTSPSKRNLLETMMDGIVAFDKEAFSHLIHLGALSPVTTTNVKTWKILPSNCPCLRSILSPTVFLFLLNTYHSGLILLLTYFLPPTLELVLCLPITSSIRR